MRRWLSFIAALGCLVWLSGLTHSLYAQSRVAAEPIVGLRENRPDDYALTHVKIVQPGQVIKDATILVQDTTIIAVGTDVEIPAGFQELDYSDRTVYPAFIDAWSEVDVEVAESDAALHWNSNITPQRKAAPSAVAETDDRDALRRQGVAVRVVAPAGRIIKGSSAAILLSDPEEDGNDNSGRGLLKLSLIHI